MCDRTASAEAAHLEVSRSLLQKVTEDDGPVLAGVEAYACPIAFKVHALPVL